MINKLWYRWVLYWNNVCPKHFLERKWDSYGISCPECSCERSHRERKKKIKQEQSMERRIATARKVLNGN